MHINMTNTIIYRLPKSNDIDELTAQMRPMKEARLRSLKQDPEKFYSRYENEVDQPAEFWIDRLRPKNVQHFVAVAVKGKPQWELEVVDEQTQFMAFMVVIKEFEDVLANAEDEGAKLPTYFLAAVWVDSSLRGHGVGSRMIQQSIEWIKEDASEHGLQKVRYRLAAIEGNDRAVELYIKLGFAVNLSRRRDVVETGTETTMDMIVYLD